MKIFMYSDLHISKSSSILPITSTENKYTYRQKMILDTGKYLASIIKETQPDLIVNLGDTFDQHTLTSYDIDVASRFFKCFADIDIPHIVLVGNHDMVNYDFNAVEILKNIDNITVVDNPITLYGNLAFMPYYDSKDILTLPEGEYLFSHLDIQGSTIRGAIKLETGLSTEKLTKYKLVFNGHIHKSSIMGNVVNVGSISTHSFADDNESVPQAYVFDTETMDLHKYKPSVCPLFRKFEIENDENELKTYLNELDNNYKYVLQITCPFEMKENIKVILQQCEKVISSRLNVKVNKQFRDKDSLDSSVMISSNIDVKAAFEDFIDASETLKYPKQLYKEILENIEKKGVAEDGFVSTGR